MNDLATKKCKPCHGGTPALTDAEIKQHREQLNPEWTVETEQEKIHRAFKFKDFYHTMGFVNAIAWMANQEDHHPDLEVGYNYCHVHFSTHAISGLSENDFICAAKVDSIYNG